MPIVASRSREIRRLLSELADPKRRSGAALRLKSLGSRVVPYVADELGRFDRGTRRVLLEALHDVDTAEAETLRRRLARAEAGSADSTSADENPAGGSRETLALADLHTLPPPAQNERAGISRERGEAHLALARAGSRLARKDLLLSLQILSPGRSRLYCEAAGLIGDSAFLAPLARIATVRPEAARALADIAKRERITPRSKALRDLEAPLRLIVAQSLV